MIFETLAHMADREDDGEDNYSSTEAQAKAVLEALASRGELTLPNEVITVAGTRYIVSNKREEYKHVLVGMQRKIPNGIVQTHQGSSSSYSMSSSSSDGTYYPSLQCAGGTEPSMALTITGASGTITWCGKVWNLPADSGLTQEVCPTAYDLSKDTIGIRNQAIHLWRFLDGSRFSMVRRYSSTPSSLFVTNVLPIRNSITSVTDYRAAFYTGSPLSLIFSYNSFGIGLISAVPDPTWGSYRLTDAFFGSHTTPGGVTFTWSKGTNW